MEKKILDRILKSSGTPALIETLSKRLSLSDLQTLLLEVYSRRAAVSPFDEEYGEVAHTVVERLCALHPDVSVGIDPRRTAGRGYYSEIAFQIHLSDSAGEWYLIVDGGFTDWMRRLLSNKKERLLISGLGSERFVWCFGNSVRAATEGARRPQNYG